MVTPASNSLAATAANERVMKREIRSWMTYPGGGAKPACTNTLEQGWRQEFSDEGAKCGFQGTIKPKNLRKNRF